MILDLQNEERGAEVKIIRFYDGYISKMARKPIYTETGQFVGCEINEDLAQELKIALFRALPKLRKAFYNQFTIKQLSEKPLTSNRL